MKKCATLCFIIIILCSGCGNRSNELPRQQSSITAAIVNDAQGIPEWKKIKDGFEENQDIGLMGYMVFEVYQADLNSDRICEYYVNSVAGSGIAHTFVQCYDVASEMYSMISDRMVMNFYATEYNDELYVIAIPYNGDGNTTVYRAALIDGKLACKDIDDTLQEAVLEMQPE